METIIWPVYIDSTRSRNQGRKIAKKNSIQEPRLTEISRAARNLKLNPKTEDDKSYPRSWWENSGRIIVEKGDLSKIEVLIKISSKIKESRKK
ncbi:signal recognition particle protein Srp19 [Methanobrevibacter filiformis]|uniref:Signal recognition particle 19 kDa protein n=1 Tax=Methanobrevibacter filiformis TaxID=55758 RepID=A0A166DAC0_9EURY|nr:signal recognition particle protein Srp19 [Methanobrevibacter filiformis]KZX15374.1 signal recognition particle protein Srp19 [Methanobrevibacter filiformis]